MEAWLAKNVAKVIAIGGIALMVVVAVLLNQCSAARTAHTETTLATWQTGAAVRSGADASSTVGNRMGADEQDDTVTRENDATIRAAPGSEATVAQPARDAGIAALCRRSAYREDKRCAH